MPRRLPLLGILLLAGCASPNDWTSDFQIDKSILSPVGDNPLFPLKPGSSQTLKHGAEELVVTVLAETKVIDGVETRIIEERESRDTKLTEISRNYFAANPANGDVYYFGEDVDTYRDGQVTGHEGSWASGVGGARFGLMMPGSPSLHMKFYQEQAPRIAMDRAEVVGVKEIFGSGGGLFNGCVRIAETTPLERGRETKIYCPGPGLVQDGDLVLFQATMP